MFDGIRNHLKVPDISFDEFFADADRLLDRLGEWASSIKKKIQKQIGKLGERVGPGVEIVSPLSQALKDIFGMQDLPEAQLDVFERNTDRLIDRLGSIAQRANKGLLRAVEFHRRKGRGRCHVRNLARRADEVDYRDASSDRGSSQIIS